MQRAKNYVSYFACLALTASGCSHHAPAMQPTRCVCVPNGPCGGFFSTCWRQWPAECVNCPPALEGPAALPAAPPGEIPSDESVPPPPPRLRDAPDELPAMPSDTGPADDLSPNDVEPPQEGRRRQRPLSSTPVKADSVTETAPAPLVVAPPGEVKLAVPESNEPVVFRRTTVELRRPADSTSGEALLTPPSFSKGK